MTTWYLNFKRYIAAFLKLVRKKKCGKDRNGGEKDCKQREEKGRARKEEGMMWGNEGNRENT